jgi:methylenetetrahydrofolate dehydrogenase (NAD+)
MPAPRPHARQLISLPVGERLEGKVVTIINRSEIVGRPLGAMLANDGQSSAPSSAARTTCPAASMQEVMPLCPASLTHTARNCVVEVQIRCPTGATIYSVDIDTIYTFKRGQLLKTDDTPESAVRKSDIIVTGMWVHTQLQSRSFHSTLLSPRVPSASGTSI